MKRKLILLSGALFLAMALTVGSFAYTFTVASVRLEATAADGGAEIATQEPAPGQPEWEEDITPWSYRDGEILRPIAAGGETQITHQEPGNGEHWDKVADVDPDDWSTFVYTSSKKYKTDLYTLSNNFEGEGTINGIVVYFRFSGHDSDQHGPTTAYAKAVIKTGGEVYEGSEESQTGMSFVTRTYLWETNPKTGEAWTWEEIDALQAGIQLKKEPPDGFAYSTQVYVEVGYTVSVTEGEVPAGDLFEIAVHPQYPGDLLVNVYLTNTAALKKAYQYLNMKLYMEDSLEAGKEPDYQILSLENGVVLFNIEGGVSANYTIKVVGGAYGLISDEPGEWGDGWSIIPEFYSEVGQR